MATEPSIEDAISQLGMLGIDRKKAIKALNRYNNDVERAADYVFSGNADSDLDDVGEFPWAQPSSFENIYSSEQQQQQNLSSGTVDANLDATFDERRAILTKDYEKTGPQIKRQAVIHDSALWSVVPFVEKPEVVEQKVEEHDQGLTKANLTWWTDPENPLDRATVNNKPVGLRPPSYNFAYSPIVIQALFHVSLFRFAVLSFRPLPYDWGPTRNYWKGFGESVSGHIIKHNDNDTMDEITMQMKNTVINDNDNGNVQTASGNVTGNETEFVTMSKDQLALAELQKLFTFLSYSKRMYGSISHFIRVFNSGAAISSSSWKMDDKNIDEFLDLFFRGLISADQSNEFMKNNEDLKELLSFHDLFQLQAEVCSGDEVDIEEVYYLNLSIDATTKTFYDCLDPLIYESFQDDSTTIHPDDEIISNASDENEVLPYKFTTFTRVPPLLFITLEDRRDFKTIKNAANKRTYTAEKTIYLDRYLNTNKSISLQKYQQADELRKEIRRTQYELQKMQHSDHDLNKHQLLDTTITYFNNKIDTAEDISENNDYVKSLKSLQNVLQQVQNNIEKKQTELKQIEIERKQQLQDIFNDTCLQEKPYDLRAVLHTDGLSGTGHYWAYIFVEPNETNLLADIGVEDGGWYWFCDAEVRRVQEEDIWNEERNPFALLYVDRSIPCLTREELDKYIPDELKNIILHDNDIFLKEIQNYNNNTNEGTTMNDLTYLSTVSANNYEGWGDASVSEQSLGEEEYNKSSKNYSYETISDSVFDEQIQEKEVVYNQHEQYSLSNDLEIDNSYDGGDDDNAKSSNESLSIDDQSMDVTAFDSIAMDTAVDMIIATRDYTSSNNIFLERFDMFLAVAGDVNTLATYIKLVDEHIQNTNNKCIDADDINTNDKNDTNSIDIKLASIMLSKVREIIKDNDSLCQLYELYLQYISMGQIITNALSLFNLNNYPDALEQILIFKQLNDSWRTHLLLNDILITKYHGLNNIGFNHIATKLGKIIIKILNKEAYKKACNISYQERGLEDGIKVANQAYQVMGNEVGEERSQFFTELSECWLTFAELQSGSLENKQAELLNTLVMIYFDGPSTRMSSMNNQLAANYANVNENENQSNLSHLFLVNVLEAENNINSM
ncbi:unnamed protein product [Cunninghamella echinulata]